MPESHAQAKKTTISYFPADDAVIRAIRSAMIQRGHDVNLSGAIRLALRSVPLTKDGLSDATAKRFATLLAEIEGEDGRKLRHE